MKYSLREKFKIFSHKVDFGLELLFLFYKYLQMREEFPTGA